MNTAPDQAQQVKLPALSESQKVWRVRILTTTWLSYAGFYFCRKNYAIAKSSIREELVLTNSELAHIYTVYLISYMLGQFLTSYVGRKIAIRTLLLSTMAVTLICNVVFGFSYLMGPAGYWPMLAFMAINGLAQGTGWPGNVGILSNWLRREERGGIMAIWATSYQLGSILAKIFAAFMLGYFGAVWSFWGAALIMLGVWIAFYLWERDTPESAGVEPIVEEVEIAVKPTAPGQKPHGFGLSEVWLSILFMGAAYFVFKFLRYALDSWSPMAIETLFQMSKEQAGYISTLFDWVGFVGVLFAGFMSDKYFRGRRHQTILLMTIGMLFAFIAMAMIGMNSVVSFGICLAICGFMLMGPDSLISGVGAIDVGGKKMALVAAAVINGLGSIGPIFQEEIISWMLDNYGYQAPFYMLAGMCVVGVIGTAHLSYRSRCNKSNL
ncbi:MAG: hypothetical protein BWK79_02820 [Beggiatoa sp. IS2]|nr:MAG: hypothetical protein BWK79_02820 [Beggiatoa sp. IS2]